MSDWFRDEAVAVTTMRIIHLPDNFDTTTRGNRHTLIHELGHVWQGENTGPYYIGHALFSQVTHGNAAYNYGGASALKANTTPAASSTTSTRSSRRRSWPTTSSC